jgi:hypothetical protein
MMMMRRAGRRWRASGHRGWQQWQTAAECREAGSTVACETLLARRRGFLSSTEREGCCWAQEGVSVGGRRPGYDRRLELVRRNRPTATDDGGSGQSTRRSQLAFYQSLHCIRDGRRPRDGRREPSSTRPLMPLTRGRPTPPPDGAAGGRALRARAGAVAETTRKGYRQLGPRLAGVGGALFDGLSTSHSTNSDGVGGRPLTGAQTPPSRPSLKKRTVRRPLASFFHRPRPRP